MNLTITGHYPNKDFLTNSWKAGRFPQSLLFSGPKSIGKFSLSINLACQIFINQDINFSEKLPQQTLTDRVKNFLHPSLLVIGHEENKEITVEEIRQINRFLSLSSAETKYRIVIIDNAEKMNLNSQNSLLKILEEPPRNSIIILISHSPDQLLPTIRSRVIESKFHIPQAEEIQSIITNNVPNSLIKLGFTPGIIKKWSELSLLSVYNTFLQYVSSIQSFSNFEIYQTVDNLQKKQKLNPKDILEVINFLNTRIVTYKVNPYLTPLIETELKSLTDITTKISLRRLIATQSYITDLIIDCIKFNLDIRQVITLIFSKYRNIN